MCSMWLLYIDVFDEGYFAQHIFVLVTLIWSAIDNRNRKMLSIFIDNQYRNLEKFIDLTSDIG